MLFDQTLSKQGICPTSEVTPQLIHKMTPLADVYLIQHRWSQRLIMSTGNCMSATVATVYILWFDAKRNETTSTCWNTVTKVLFQKRSKVCAQLSVLAAITVPTMPCRPCSAATADTWFLLSTFHQASLLFLALQDFIVELVTVLKHWDLQSIPERKAAVEFLHHQSENACFKLHAW